MITFRQFRKKRDDTFKMLLKFHEAFEKLPNDPTQEFIVKGDDFFDKELIKWLNELFKEQTGLGIGSSFTARTLWSNMQRMKKGEPFKTYLRVDRNQKVKEDLKYFISLQHHCMNADTDMGDTDVMTIEFGAKSYKEKYFIMGYSYNFG
jgi:hypothetical protein